MNLNWSTTMTAGDMALVIVLGCASIALIAFVVRLPRMASAALLWWAERSAAARAAKLRKLTSELDEYRTLLNEPIQFMGRAMGLLGRMLLAGLLMLGMLGAACLTFLLRLQEKLTPLPVFAVTEGHPLLKDAFERFFQGLALTMVLVLLVSLSFRADRFLNFVRQIETLHDYRRRLNGWSSARR